MFKRFTSGSYVSPEQLNEAVAHEAKSNDWNDVDTHTLAGYLLGALDATDWDSLLCGNDKLDNISFHEVGEHSLRQALTTLVETVRHIGRRKITPD